MLTHPWVPDRSEIIWINFNPLSGREMHDMHPMLVLSPKKFNDRTGVVIGLPMSSAEYHSTNPFAVAFEDKSGFVCYVLAHQPQSFDWRRRNAKIHHWKAVSKDVFATVCERLNQILLLTE